MKQMIFLVVASLILVGAIVAIAVPNTVQAEAPHIWCNSVVCYPTHGECNQSTDPNKDCFKSLAPH